MWKEKNESVARFITDGTIPESARRKMERLRNKLDKINALYQTTRARIITAQSKLMRSCGV